MKKLITLIIFFMLIGLLGAYICLNRPNYIAAQKWLYNRGGWVGDWIEFDTTLFLLKDNKIYKRKKYVGSIVVCIGHTLIIRSNEDNRVGYYSNKSK